MLAVIYKWHRRLSIIIALPVLLWAATGLMHPLMTNIRPAIATQGWPVISVDSSRIKVSASEALSRHHLDSVAAIRLVHIDTNWFYQVMPVARPGMTGVTPQYFSCLNGNVLPAGDWLYAQYLARHFLEGDAAVKAMAQQASAPAPAVASPTAARDASVPDCCGAATDCVLHPAQGAAVLNVSAINSYTSEYKSINRLLPVYQVVFDRKDGIRVYVETTHDRYSFAMDNKRAIFDRIFQLFHTWAWLDLLGKGKLFIEILFALAAFTTSLMGIWLFFATSPGHARNNPLVRRRAYHRYTAIFASLFTLLWTFSGGYHALAKFRTDDRDRFSIGDHFATADLSPDMSRLAAVTGRPVANWGLVRIDGTQYWRVDGLSSTSSAHKDLMKELKAAMPTVAYVRCKDYSVLNGGDSLYAKAMATRFSGLSPESIQLIKPITAFGDEYNFTDKRLPVWEVAYNGAGHPRFFVETSSGKLASFVDSRMVAEGWSFSVFHKHHFMDWAGKSVRDGSTIFWALMQVLMVGIGLWLYFTRVLRNRNPAAGKK